MRLTRSHALGIMVASLVLSATASAQCPNGTPPPCTTAPKPPPPSAASIQKVPNGLARLTANYQNTRLRDIRMELGALLGRTIIASIAADTVRLTARIVDQPWDVALRSLLLAHKLDGEENEHGILLIQTLDEIAAQKAAEPVVTRIIVLRRPARELAEVARIRLTSAGRVDIDTVTNALIITDRAAVVEGIMHMIMQLDRRTPNPRNPPQFR